MRGSTFIRSLPAGGDTRAIEARESAVVDAVKSGMALPIVWMPVHTEIPGHTATLYVASDTLRFGEPGPNDDPTDWDWVRIAVTADTAQRIADILGVLLPTDRIADLAHAQASVRLTPHWQTTVTATTEGMLAHHAAIETERAGRDGLLSTIGKDWILGRELFPAHPGGPPLHPLGWDGAINYGWHTHGPATRSGPYVGQPGVILWQTKGFKHNRRHVDYSQWVPRLVHPSMQVDGRWVATSAVMRSPELAALVTYDGPLPDTRYPRAPGGADNRGATGQKAALAGAADTGTLDPFADLSSDAGDPWSDLTDAFERERQRERAWLKGTWVKDTWLGRFLRLDEPNAPAASPAPAPTTNAPELRPKPIVLRPEPDTGVPSEEPLGWGRGAALATLLQQIDRRFPYRGKGLLDGLGQDEVLRITDDPGMNGSYRSGPDLEALRGAVLADRRTLRTDSTTDRVRTRYLAVIARPAPAWSHDPSAWDLTALDARARPEASTAEVVYATVNPEQLVTDATGDGWKRLKLVARAPAEAAWELTALDPRAQGEASAADIAGASDTSGTQGQKALQGAKVGAAIGGTVGTALEAVPVFGPLLHLIATGVGAAAGAIAGAVSGAHHRDAFKPTPMQAAAWLALFHIAPSMVFAGLDDITVRIGDPRHPAEEHAARLVRYFLLVSGFVRSSGPLVDPNDMRGENPYMARVDPRYPLTDPKHLRRIKHLLLARQPIPSEVTTPAQARLILNLLRRTLGPSGIMGWAEARHHRDGLRQGVQYVRAIAGEVGPDAYLARLFGGDVTPPRRSRPHVLRRRPAHTAPPSANTILADTDPFADLHRDGSGTLPPPDAPPDDPYALPGDALPDGSSARPTPDAPPDGAGLLAVPDVPPDALPVPVAPGASLAPSPFGSDASGVHEATPRAGRSRKHTISSDPFADLKAATRPGGHA